MVKRKGGGKSGSPVKARSVKKKWTLHKRIIRYILIVVIALLSFTILQVVLLKWVPPLFTPVMLADKWQRILDKEKDIKVHYFWKSHQNLSPYIYLAVIAAEDQKFPDHFGFDFEAIEKAFENNKKGKRIRGASTITQQVAKNLFLWSGRSYFRKGLEAYYTILLEVFWSKDRILEVYVNIVEMGTGVYGVEAASQMYFKKPALKLNRSEASLLAAVLPNPKRYSVRYPSPYVLKRRDWVARQMVQLGDLQFLQKII
jgi:monofunctional glycosyltransferase